MTVRRRDFLRNAAAGGAILTMPLFLQGCGVAPATRLAEPLPDDPFLGWFAIDRSVIARTMAALTANGADSAELYFQHRRQSYLGIDNGDCRIIRLKCLRIVGDNIIKVATCDGCLVGNLRDTCGQCLVDGSLEDNHDPFAGG